MSSSEPTRYWSMYASLTASETASMILRSGVPISQLSPGMVRARVARMAALMSAGVLLMVRFLG